jgi:hypothetical protein
VSDSTLPAREPKIELDLNQNGYGMQLNLEIASYPRLSGRISAFVYVATRYQGQRPPIRPVVYGVSYLS